VTQPRPLVSIVTPSYDQAQFLEATIQSVIGQDYPHVEHIVIDGGSTDGSVEIVRKYADRLAYWVSEPDRGQSDAINKGLGRARGEVLAWLNSDDVYLPGCVSAAVAFLLDHPEVGMAYGDVEVIDVQGRTILRPRWDEYDWVRQLTHRITIPQPAAFFRREVTDRVGRLRTDLHYAMDLEFWLRIGRRYPIRRIGQTLAQFRLHPVSKSMKAADQWGAEFITVLDDLFADAALPTGLVRIKSRAYGGAYLHAAASALVVYDMPATRQRLRQAVRAYIPIVGRPQWWSVLARSLLGRRGNQIARSLKAWWSGSRYRLS